MKSKMSRFDFEKMKRSGSKVTWVKAYDYPTASFAEQADMDMILVGDSLGMCVYGYTGTIPVTMDQCIVTVQGFKVHGSEVEELALFEHGFQVSVHLRSYLERRNRVPATTP
jgi:ketopantoate hydroxymethyltransferase